MSDQRQEASLAYPDWNGTVRDHKAWAKRLLYREQHGDKNISVLQAQFAREALEIPDPKKKP